MVEPVKTSRTRRRFASLAIGVVVVALIVAGAAAVWVKQRQPLPVNQKRIAVAAFTYGIPDESLEPVGSIIADWITRGLAQTGLVDVVDGRSAAEPAGSKAQASSAPADFGETARATGAVTIVAGNYCRRGDTLEIEARVLDAASGKVLRALDPVRTPIDTPLEGIEELRQRVMGALAPMLDPRLIASAGETAALPNYVAYAEFLDGLESHNRGDWRTALRHLRRAHALDSAFIQPLLFAATVYADLRPATAASGDKADSLLGLVTAHRHRLGPLDQSVLDWLVASRRGDRLGALANIRRAAELWPDRYLYNLGHDAYRMNRPREAIDAFTRLDPERGFMRGWDASYADYTAALHVLGEDREALRVAVAGRKQYPDRLSTLYNEAAIRSALGQEAAVATLLDESLSLPPQRERTNATPGEIMLTAGLELKAHGHAHAAIGTLDRAGEWFARQPEPLRLTPDNRKTLIAIDLARGRDAQAAGECREMARRRPSDTHTRWCLGMLAARRGERAVADSLIDVLERMSAGRLPPVRRLYQAEIAAALGDRERAVALLRKGLGSGLAFGVEHHANPFLQPLAGFPPFEELIKPKG